VLRFSDRIPRQVPRLESPEAALDFYDKWGNSITDTMGIYGVRMSPETKEIAWLVEGRIWMGRDEFVKQLNTFLSIWVSKVIPERTYPRSAQVQYQKMMESVERANEAGRD